MSTDIIDPTETIAETINRHLDDPDTFVFYSRASRLRLLRQHKTEVPITTGGWIQGQPSVRYEFMAGSLAVTKGQDVLPDGPQEYDEEAGEFRPTKQDAVTWLMAHSAFNVDFWLEGEEPGRLSPTDREVHVEITDALIERDAVRLVRIIEQEKRTHQRKQLIDAAKDALDRLTRLQGVPAETPTTASAPAGEVFDREAAILELMGLDVEVPEMATDEQIQAALIVSRPVSEQSG